MSAQGLSCMCRLHETTGRAEGRGQCWALAGLLAGGGCSEKKPLMCFLQGHWLCQSLASVSPTEIIASFQGTFSSFYFVSLEGDFVNTQFLCFLKQGLLFAKKCDIMKNQGQTVSPILLFVSLLLCLSSPLLLTCPWPPNSLVPVSVSRTFAFSRGDSLAGSPGKHA